jgi:hypothetical protein
MPAVTSLSAADVSLKSIGVIGFIGSKIYTGITLVYMPKVIKA